MTDKRALNEAGGVDCSGPVSLNSPVFCNSGSMRFLGTANLFPTVGNCEPQFGKADGSDHAVRYSEGISYIYFDT